MAILDLNTRLTDDWTKCHQHDKLADSMVFTSIVADGVNSPTTVELKVGHICIKPGDSKTYKIDEKGLKIRPKQTWVVYTEQNFYLPLNVFGLVTGKGNFIFQGCLISSGKIDPGFTGPLKIGFYNGSNDTIVLKTGDSFATAFFMTMEATLEAPLKEYQSSPSPTTSTIGRWSKSIDWLRQHGWQIATMIVALVPSVISLWKWLAD